MTTIIHDEQTPLLKIPTVIKNDNRDRYGLWIVRLALVLLIIIVFSILAKVPISVFSLHPLFMILFIITMTEGIVTLQLTQTKQEKRQGLGRHAILQLSAFFSAIIGFSAIFYNKVLLNKDHFISGHGKLGILVLSYLLLQVIFGIFCASTPHRLALPIKKLWKYHRITGYIFFILVWVTAVFGIQTDYMITNSWIIPSRYLSSNWIFLFVVIANVGILLRLRFYKLKGQVTLGDHPPSSSPSSSSL